MRTPADHEAAAAMRSLVAHLTPRVNKKLQRDPQGQMLIFVDDVDLLLKATTTAAKLLEEEPDARS